MTFELDYDVLGSSVRRVGGGGASRESFDTVRAVFVLRYKLVALTLTYLTLFYRRTLNQKHLDQIFFLPMVELNKFCHVYKQRIPTCSASI